MELFKEPFTFDWDAGNRDKNFIKHRVSHEESEEVFFDPHKRILEQVLYTDKEIRHVLVGYTKEKRALLVVFTIRKDRIRIISARDLNKKERGFLHEKAT